MAAMVPHFEALSSWSGQAGGFGGNLTVVDKVPAEMLHLIDPHWYQFPPMNPLWHSILGFAMVMLGLISTIGNGCVILIFTTTKALRTPSNLFVVNLAFSDFLMMATMSPPMVVNCYYETWHFGRKHFNHFFLFKIFIPIYFIVTHLFIKFLFPHKTARMCEIYAMLGSLFGCTSIWTMTMIAFDRYNVIVKGLSAKPLTSGGAVLRIAGIWGNALVWTLLPMFGWNRYVPEGNMTACGTDYLSQDLKSRSYIMVYSFFVYTMPLLLIIYSYFYIIQVSILIGQYCNLRKISLFRLNLTISNSTARLFFSFSLLRLSQLTKRTCVNKPRK